MDYKKLALENHSKWRGKIEMICRAPLNDATDLAIAYTPGVAEPCLEIQKDISLSYEYTRRWNTVAVITDGTAVLGLGDIGPEAGMPVMEGKCALFKTFGGVDAIPLCIRSKDVDEIVKSVSLFAGSFGGINLEDISGPRCFEIEEKLQKACDIPIFHDDQHGTAIVTLAALKNALKLSNKKMSDISILISGAGAAGIAICKLLLKSGVKDIILTNSKGVVKAGNSKNNPSVEKMAQLTNLSGKDGQLKDVIKGMDVFVGVSAPNILTKEMVESMGKDPIIFALSNPTPEIMPDVAKAGGAKIVGTGRSDFPNQINNVLAFPGIFRGALDVRASVINDEMKIAAAQALADFIKVDKLHFDYILPSVFEVGVGDAVAEAVKKAAIDSGVSRI